MCCFFFQLNLLVCSFSSFVISIFLPDVVLRSLFTDVKTASYLGCFKDSPSSHDLEYLTEIRPLSIRACLTKCKSMRFPYAGLQSSTSCYCGLHYGKYGQVAHEDCNTPCEADSSEMCGGVSKNSLYNTGKMYSNID